MFKLILVSLLITYALCAPADDDSFKVDDFDDDWGLEDSKQDSKDTEIDSEATQPDAAKGPVSYIQKIPRRGEKVSTQAPVEIIPQEAEEVTIKRERRDTLTREQKKEQRRLNKKNKQNKEAAAVDGVHSSIPETPLDENHQASTKRPRKQKTHKQGKNKNNEETLPGQSPKKQRQGSKKNKENKKDKVRPDGRPQRQGKNGQRQRKQRTNKHQSTEPTLQ